MTETAAGRMARTMPELDRRELSALVCENTQATLTDGTRTAERAIRDRAEDAQLLGYAKAHVEAVSPVLPVQYSEFPAYWAALS